MSRFSLIILSRNISRINSWAILQSSRNIWQISSSGSTHISRLALTVTWWYLIIFHSNINLSCGILFFFGSGVALKSCQLFRLIYIPCSKLKFKKETYCFFGSLCRVSNDFPVYSNVHNALAKSELLRTTNYWGFLYDWVQASVIFQKIDHICNASQRRV